MITKIWWGLWWISWERGVGYTSMVAIRHNFNGIVNQLVRFRNRSIFGLYVMVAIRNYMVDLIFKNKPGIDTFQVKNGTKG
jgi:hypothetical protein